MAARPRRVVEVRKGDLDTRVAALLGKKREEISVITTTLLRVVIDELSEMSTVHLDGLGELRVVVRKGKRPSRAVLTKGTFGRGKTEEARLVRVEKKYYVTFKKAAPLRLAIQARQGAPGKTVKVMEKLGVDEQAAENEKLAADGCPLCGAKVERHGSVLVCPTHGTEPFEGNKKRK